MSSTRKQEAARRNGAQSKGPVTLEGKAASSLNSMRHGLTGSILVLTNEDRSRFQQFLQDHIQRFQPADAVELNLVEEMCAAAWRQRRCWAIETALLDLEMVKQDAEIEKIFDTIDETTRLALAFKGLADNSGSLALLGRYESRFRRQYEKAFQQLRLLQQERRAGEPPPAEAPPRAASVYTLPPPTSHPPIAALPNEPTVPQPPAASSDWPAPRPLTRGHATIESLPHESC